LPDEKPVPHRFLIKVPHRFPKNAVTMSYIFNNSSIIAQHWRWFLVVLHLQHRAQEVPQRLRRVTGFLSPLAEPTLRRPDVVDAVAYTHQT
jgi:hypothetical protein